MQCQIQLYKSMEFQVFILAAPIENNMIFAKKSMVFQTYSDTIPRTLRGAFRGQNSLSQKVLNFYKIV